MGLLWMELTNLHFSEFWTSLPWICKILAYSPFLKLKIGYLDITWMDIPSCSLQWEQEVTIKLVPDVLHCYQIWVIRGWSICIF